MGNTVVWADIPVTDMDRARRFYGELLQAEIVLMDGADGNVALLPGEQGSVSADLAKGEQSKPGVDGPTIYIDAMDDIEGAVERAKKAGGQVLMPPADMGEMIGTIAFILDTEGNKIGLHVPPKM